MRFAGPVLLTLALFFGCEAPENIGPIDSVMVLTKQRTESFDGDQVPDGFWASVFLYRNSESKPVAVTNVKGRLDLILYNGSGRNMDLNLVPPLHVWTFDHVDLQSAEGKMLGQKCFILRLLWGKKRPSHRMITLRAKYTDPNQRMVFSKLQILPSGVK